MDGNRRNKKMKEYKVLKELPFAKAGDKVYIYTNEYNEWYEIYKHKADIYSIDIRKEEVNNFNEWFEEVVENNKLVYYINIFNCDVQELITNNTDVLNKMEETGLCFKTEEEAKKMLRYLKVRAATIRNPKKN